MLVEQATKGHVELIQPDPPDTVRPYIVPGLMRQALHVVGQVAGEVDDGVADARLGSEAGLLKARLQEAGELVGRNALEAETGPAL